MRPRPSQMPDPEKDEILDPRLPPAERERLRLLIGAYAGSGLALLAVVAVGLGGIGPLAP
jgi:hypothetical protein